jgi:photosystem II stability/assembly factor-like uncharacterized protein
MKHTFWGFLSTLCLCISCGKKQIEIPHQNISLQTTDNINSIHFIHPDTGYLSTGMPFIGGGSLHQTTDGGRTWLKVLESPQSLAKISHSAQRIYVAMFGNLIYHKARNSQQWESIFILGWDNWKKAVCNSQDQGIVLGGRNFGEGFVKHLNSTTLDQNRDTFVNELSDAVFLDESTVVAVGYGAILKSSNAGVSWSPVDVRGDFYRAVHFPTAQIGYVVGEYGSVLKSTDAGNTWKKLERASTLFNNKKRLQNLYFADAQLGYVVGKKGLFWRTTDGGERWELIETDENIDWNAVFAVGDKVFLVGSGGNCWQFDF